MLEIEGYAAPSEDDPSSYAQVTKVTGAQTILFIAGQVAYDDTGGPAHGRDFAAQARAVFRLLQAQAQASRRAEGRCHRHPVREELVLREEVAARHPGRRPRARPAGMGDRGHRGAVARREADRYGSVGTRRPAQ